MQPIVYILDSDDRTRRDFAQAIERAGMQARGFESAESFLEQGWRTFDACLLADIDLPGIDGLSLLKRMREMGRPIPTLFMSSRYEMPAAV